MKQRIYFLGSRLLLVLVRILGPYRLWRMIHEMACCEPDSVRELFEYVFKAELPARLLREPFMDYWLSEGMLVRGLRQGMYRQSASVGYAVRLYHELIRIETKWGGSGGRVLELGPGTHLGTLFCFAAEGRSRVTGVDIAPISQQDREFYQRLKDYLAASSGLGWWRHYAYANRSPQITHPTFWDLEDADTLFRRIEYLAPYSADALPLDQDSLGLVYSVTAFEHFPNPKGAVAEIRRILHPGGLTVHEIDMRYHVDMRNHPPGTSLEFLTWSEEQLTGRSEKYGDGRGLRELLAGEWSREVYCNRLRLSDYCALFEQQGLEVLEVEPLELLDVKAIDRTRFVEPFRSKPLDDLAVLVARITARKPRV